MVSIEDPIAQNALLFEACAFKQPDAVGIVFAYQRIQLMEMERGVGVPKHVRHGGETKALVAVSVQDDDPHLGPSVLRIEIHQVDHTYRIAIPIANHQPHLMVHIDVARSAGYVLMEGIARIRFVGHSDAPKRNIVFHLVEQIEILGFEGTQRDVAVRYCWLMCFHILMVYWKAGLTHENLTIGNQPVFFWIPEGDEATPPEGGGEPSKQIGILVLRHVEDLINRLGHILRATSLLCAASLLPRIGAFENGLQAVLFHTLQATLLVVVGFR